MGHHRSTYNIWYAMVRRCHDPRRKDFKWYGGRGIAVCDRWRTFENFLADMGERPEGREIDRIDNNGPYEPGNCRWVAHAHNIRNQRHGGGTGGRDQYGLRRLAVGDAIILPFDRPTQVRGSVDNLARTIGLRFSLRRLPENKYLVRRTA